MNEKWNNKPICFWALNHRLEKEEMNRQLKEMKAGGLGGVILHPRSGLLTPYLSDEFFEMIGHILEECQRLEIDAWLYDEDPYPSGIAGGRVITDKPEYRAQALKYIKKRTQPDGGVTLDVPMEKIVGAYAIRLENEKLAEMIDLRSKMGLLRERWEKERKYCTYYPTTYTKAKPQNRADTFDPFYRLKWMAPSEGEWEIIVFYTVKQSDFWVFPSFTDLLNPEAVDYFISLTYGEYYKRFGKYFGNVVKGFFVDEPKYLADPLPWTDQLPELFESRYSCDFKMAMAALVMDFEGAEQLRRDFWETVQDRFIESFPHQVRMWCEDHNLKLIGHCSPEEDPIGQVMYTGSIMHFMNEMHISGTDFLTHQIGGKQYPILAMGPILTASVSRQHYDGRVLCETFGVTEWQLSYEDMTRIANWLYSGGVNTFVWHVFMYSMDGYRKMDAGPSQFYQSPAWRYFGNMSGYMERVSGFFEKLVPEVETGLFYPIESFWITYHIYDECAKEARNELTVVMNELIDSHVMFDFIDYRDFENAVVSDGYLYIDKARYRKIILPPVYYFSDAARAVVAAAKRQGIFVIVCEGTEPVHVDLQEYADEIWKLSGDEFSGYSVIISAGVSGRKKDELLIFSGKYEGKRAYWIFNPADRAMKADIATLTGFDSCLIWNPAMDQYSYLNPVQEIIISAGTALVFLEKDEEASAVGRAGQALWLTDTDTAETVLELSGKWEWKPTGKNLLRLGKWVFTSENSIQEKSASAMCGADTREELFAPEYVNFEHQTNGVCPGILQEYADLSYPATVWYKTVIDISGYAGPIFLLKETSSIAGKWTVYANGKEVDNWESCCEYDCYNERAALLPYLYSPDNRLYRAGELTLAVCVTAASARDGMVFPIYLEGDFRVRLNNRESIGASLYQDEGWMYIGSWAEQGYPHFGGPAVYSQTVALSEVDPEYQYYIKVYAEGEPVTIRINGQNAGCVFCEPYVVEVTDLIQLGENIVELETAGTLQNMLFDLHEPSGITRPVVILRKKRAEEKQLCYRGKEGLL